LTEAALEAVTATGGHVPAIFWFELLYGLARLQHRGIVPLAHVDEFAAQIARFRLLIDSAVASSDVIALYQTAHRHELNIYDAAYLELALRLRVPLVTRDARLAKSAEGAGVPMFKP
jgi:predicted nucleic acid-binding protein